MFIKILYKNKKTYPSRLLENINRSLAFSLFLILSILYLPNNAFAQTPPSNLNGSELRTWLKQNWYNGKHNELGYNEARKKMYGFIDNHNGTITCVYSGFERSNSYGNQTTFPKPINTEHTVPQSFFGSSEPMKSDIHAIFPTYIPWNSERGNSPFLDIPDNATEVWMRDNDAQGSIPSANIDEYSESITNGSFEPREDHKGNTARAIFYFYTMYPQVGPITEVASIGTLCSWHAADPPNSREIARNDGAEQYQGNRNPYIDMPELAEKAWGCVGITPVTEVEGNSDNLTITPNPFNGRFSLTFSTDSNEKITVRLYDMKGQRIWKKSKTMDSDGLFRLEFDESIPAGTFILTLIQGTNIYHKKLIKN